MTTEDKEKFVKSLEGKNLEDLKKVEEALTAEADEIDKNLAKHMFKVPTANYKETCEAIRYFLNTQTVGWQYTLGLVTLYEFWDPEKVQKEVNYPTLDATLRNIGSMNFKGYEEWKRVVAINEFFNPLQKEYVKATQAVYDMAEKHNMLLDKMKIFEPTPEV